MTTATVLQSLYFLWRTLREIVLCELAAVQGLFFCWLGLVFPVSAATVGLFMSQIRGFCEHVPMPGESGVMRLRSHTSNPFERPFIHYLNYNYHGEHHRYPRVPSKNLPALSRWLAEQGQPVERSPSYLATLIARWRVCGGTTVDGQEDIVG